MRTAYFHCSSGISGDMCLGALIHGGADFKILKQQLSLLPLDNYEITYTTEIKNGISVGKFNVLYTENHPHRHLSDIISIINASALAPEIKKKSIDIFSCLAQAEAKIHGTTLEKIHFHEVGAVDAIIDIVGTVICLSLLKVDMIISSPLPMGHGFITCAHGTLPLPAPATREILKGIPQYGIDIEGELVTPTGAAIIATLAHSFGQLPEMKVDSYGYGTGTKEYSIPNILTVSLGRSKPEARLTHEEVTIVETSLDDMNPEIFSYLWEVIFSLGALDMYITPIYMKKGRPGSLVTVLCRNEDVEKITSTLLKETSSLGVRIRLESRHCCPRKKIIVQTKFGEVSVKIGFLEGIANLAPEYDDCRNLSKMHHVSLKEVYLEALVEAKKTL